MVKLDQMWFIFNIVSPVVQQTSFTDVAASAWIPVEQKLSAWSSEKSSTAVYDLIICPTLLPSQVFFMLGAKK